MPLEVAFPNLETEGYTETSPATRRYNCIAWAAERTDAWWWPDPMNIHFWPSEIARTVSLDAFMAAFESLGYARTDEVEVESGYQRIAIYARDGTPTHAARQLPDGTWTSKLGEWLDVSHTLRGLDGPLYGSVAILMKRPILVAAA